MAVIMRPSIITITDNAIKRMNYLISNRGKPTIGIRVGVRKGGCSGLTYTVEFADTEQSGDTKVVKDNITVFIDPKAELFLLGTEMDFVEEKLSSGFVFRNPNEKGRCGCGESFHT